MWSIFPSIRGKTTKRRDLTRRPAPQPPYPAAVRSLSTNDDSEADGHAASKETRRSSMAAARAASENGGKASNKKYARVVAEVSRVRTPWRQFHRRQVTPTASAQTTSPGLTTASSSNGSPPAANPTGPAGPRGRGPRPRPARRAPPRQRCSGRPAPRSAARPRQRARARSAPRPSTRTAWRQRRGRRRATQRDVGGPARPRPQRPRGRSRSRRLEAVGETLGDNHPGAIAAERGEDGGVDREVQSASCWYAIDWNDSRCSGETPSFSIAARCSGVE